MKANKLLIPLLIGLTATMGYSQNGWIWNKHFSQSPNPSLINELDIYRVRYSELGNIYVFGSYKSNFTVEGNNYIGYPDASATALDMFVVKFDANGNRLWVITIGGNSGEQPDDMAVDASENVYISGFFQGTCNFNPGSTLTSSGGNDGFIAKYAPTGQLLWTI